MGQQVFAYIMHSDGAVADTALELSTAARSIDANVGAVAVICGNGPALDAAAAEMTSVYSEVWKVADEALAYADAEVIRELLARIIPAGSIILVAHDHLGMDLAPGLAVKLGAAYLPDAVAFEGLTGNSLKAVREEYGGMVSTHMACDVSQGAVITIRPGGFKPDEQKGAGGQIIDKSADAIAGGIAGGGRRFLEVVEAEKGDVDITKSDILVSIGRGIEDEDNMEIAFELAEAMGGDVSCSRPIVDAKWLEKARQVGTSGQTVKPKVYMALGISGSFQHLGGIKGAPYMVAVNKNPKAPIFQVADVGVVADILDFIPELADKINEAKG